MKKTIGLFTAMILLLSLCACTTAQLEGPSSEVSQGPTWQEQYDLGVRYLSEGSYEEAILAFTAAIEIDPKQAPAYVGRGDAYVKFGETESNLAAAKADYEKAIGLDETSAEAYLGLADVYIRQGDAEAARAILKQGLETTGDARFQERLDELDELERQENRPEGASETVTAIGYCINNLDVDVYSARYDSYSDQYPRIQMDEGYWASGVCIRNCGIRFAATVNAQFSGNIITLQEAEANNLWELFGEEDFLAYFVNTDGTSGSMIGRWMELTGYFIPREEPGELTGPEYNEDVGCDMYTYHPNGDYYFYIESYTLLD